MATKPNKEFCKIVEKALGDIKAQDVVKIDLFNKSSLCDYMFIVTGTSSRHARAIADTIVKAFKDIGIHNILIEGGDSSTWLVIDIGDVIVHVFQGESREVYKLEEIWKKD